MFSKTEKKFNLGFRIWVYFQIFFFIEITYRWPDLSNFIARTSCLFELIDVDKEGLCRHQVTERDMML